MTAIGPKEPRRVFCRAQEEDRPQLKAQRQPAGHCAGSQPGRSLLQAATGAGQRPEADAPRIDRVHTEFPFAGSRMRCGLPVQQARPGRAAAYRHADEADGHRGPLPQAGQLETGAGAQGLPLSAAPPGRARPNQVWAMDIPDIPMAPGVRHGLEPVAAHGSRRGLLVQQARPGLAPVDHTGSGVLPRDCRGSPGPLWNARDLQYGAWSRHRFEAMRRRGRQFTSTGFIEAAGRPWHQHGRKGRGARQASGIPSDRWPSCPRSSRACGGPPRTRSLTRTPCQRPRGPRRDRPASDLPQSAGI